MQPKLLTREVAPFLLTFAGLVAATVLADALMHRLGIVWIGRYLGIAGTLFIVASFAYSLRKRKIIRTGNPTELLRRHEYLAWFGSLLILVHAGIHFNAILGWLAIIAVLINICSGLAGKFLLDRARKRMNDSRATMVRQGMSAAQLQDRIYWDTMTFDVVKQWRTIHFPITLVFLVLTLAHVIAVFLFWGWR
jgi:cytochrome b561